MKIEMTQAEMCEALTEWAARKLSTPTKPLHAEIVFSYLPNRPLDSQYAAQVMVREATAEEAKGDPVASLFRVTLQYGREDETRPTTNVGVDRLLAVVAKDAEAAITRARARVWEEVPSGERARVVCVEFIHAIDVQ